MTCTLYRFFDADDRLLYVGITDHPSQRWGQHRDEKSWWGDVAYVRLEHFPDRATALAGESSAILAEMPRHNLRGARSPHRIGITELRTHAKTILASLGDQDVVVMQRGRPVAVLIHPDRIERLIDRIEDLEDTVSVLQNRLDKEPSEPFDKVRADLGL